MIQSGQMEAEFMRVMDYLAENNVHLVVVRDKAGHDRESIAHGGNTERGLARAYGAGGRA